MILAHTRAADRKTNGRLKYIARAFNSATTICKLSIIWLMTYEPHRLTRRAFAAGLDELARRDGDLAALLALIGPPPFWTRPPGFGTLLHIILEQQVSLASARAAYQRLLALADPMTPEHFVTFDDATLRAAGLSWQKAAYGRGLAHALLSGSLDLARLPLSDDNSARAALLGIKGIGPWTAEIYLLMALRRPDVWPTGDLALAIAVQKVKHRTSLPSRSELEALGEPWRPWRAVAARLLWHQYLTQRGRS